MADSGEETQGPQNREKAVSVAYLRYLGCSQNDAANTAGVGERTVRRWEGQPWWPEIKQEAADRWLSGLQEKARAGLERGVSEDGKLALSVLERLDDRFLPPKQRTELTGRDGEPLQVAVTRRVIKPDADS